MEELQKTIYMHIEIVFKFFLVSSFSYLGSTVELDFILSFSHP